MASKIELALSQNDELESQQKTRQSSNEWTPNENKRKAKTLTNETGFGERDFRRESARDSEVDVKCR